MGFMGGSAPAMANQIAEGFILLNASNLKGMSPGELGSLRAELEKLQREVRALVTPQDDALASQARNRRIARLNAAVLLVTHRMTARN
jgi:hypothetical protein